MSNLYPRIIRTICRNVLFIQNENFFEVISFLNRELAPGASGNASYLLINSPIIQEVK